MINLEQNLYTRDGLVLKEYLEYVDIDEFGEQKTTKVLTDMTLKSALCNALLKDSMRGITIENVVEKYDLYLKIKDVSEIEFTQEEFTVVANAIVEKYPVFFAGQVIKLIK